MKLVIQRVTNASIEVDAKTTNEIKNGLMVLVGFGLNDTVKEVEYLANKLIKLRIFEDKNEKMNLSIRDINGELLLVPQFTLYGTTKKNRPSFHNALNPTKASKLFDYFVNECSKEVIVKTGIFGAFMKVNLINNGPVTILLEKESD